MTSVLEELHEKHDLSRRTILEIQELRETVEYLAGMMEEIKDACSDDEGNPKGLFGKCAWVAATASLNNRQVKKFTKQPEELG